MYPCTLLERVGHYQPLNHTASQQPKVKVHPVICDSCRHEAWNPVRVDLMFLCADCAADLSSKVLPSAEADKMASWLINVFENDLIPVAIYDPFTMKFIDANDEALKLCGYERADIVGLGLPDVVVSMDDMEPLLRRRFQPVMKSGPFEIRVPSGRFAVNTLGALTTYKQQRCRIVAIYPIDVAAQNVDELSASLT